MQFRQFVLTTLIVLFLSVRGSNSFFHILKLIIRVNDTNDHAPNFRYASVLLNVSETSPPGTRLNLPVAEDDDSDTYGVTQYQLEPPSTRQLFDISFTVRPDGSQEVN
jgi:hypothetical protein